MNIELYLFVVFFNIMLLKYQPTFINTSNFENPKKNDFHSREDI